MAGARRTRQRVPPPRPQPAPRAARALPALGDWDGPLYGALGTLATDGERVQCHICGRWYRFLANHVWRTHEVTADEYRALFGLAATHGLVAPTLTEQLRRHAL